MDTIVLYVIAGTLLVVSFFADRGKTGKALKKGIKAFEGILPQFLVVLVLVAIVLAVLDTTTVSRIIGAGSGIWGVIVAVVIGAVTLIPGFVAFPAVAALMRSGAGATQAAAFVSSLMMVGVVTLPMEIRYFGRRVAVTRNLLALGFSFVVAFVVGWAVGL
jgi:uncharacterized membrane protein YraQ (UPF0718 family)